MVEETGIEPANPCLQGKVASIGCSLPRKWWMRRDSNPQSPACRAGAAPFSYPSKVERVTRIELADIGLEARALTIEGTPAKRR